MARKIIQIITTELNWEHPKFAKSPQAISLGLILQSLPSAGSKTS